MDMGASKKNKKHIRPPPPEVLKLLRLQGAPWERKIAMNSLRLGWERKKSSAPKLHLETYTRDDLHKVVYFEPQSALVRDARP